jgi:hypothetical protein
MAFRVPDVENKIPLKNFSSTAPNSGSPSPQSSNTSLFSNFQLETSSIFSAFIINLPSASFLCMRSDSTTHSNIHRTCCQSFISTFTSIPHSFIFLTRPLAKKWCLPDLQRFHPWPLSLHLQQRTGDELVLHICGYDMLHLCIGHVWLLRNFIQE